MSVGSLGTGTPAGRGGRQARLMGHRWRDLAERERFRHAPARLALPAAATRWRLAHGREGKQMNLDKMRLWRRCDAG